MKIPITLFDLNYYLNMMFTGLSGQEFAFLPNGDAPARYRILNYRQVDRGRFEWKTVGFFLGQHLYLDSQSTKRIHKKEQVKTSMNICNQLKEAIVIPNFYFITAFSLQF